MVNKIRVLTQCEIPGLFEDVDFFSIGGKLDLYANNLVPCINIDDIDDWNISILIVARSTNGIGIYKKIKRYPSDKEFEVSISIAIPNESDADYGTRKALSGFYVALDENKFHIINVDYGKYTNLYDYIYCSAKNAIMESFKHGFTCNGKKIKYKNDSYEC